MKLKKFDLIGEKASHNSFLCSFDLICFPSLKFINPDLILSKRATHSPFSLNKLKLSPFFILMTFNK